MKHLDRIHPLSAFFYFVAVLLVAMLSMDPVIVTLCFLSGIALCGMLIGPRRLLGSLLYSIPMLLLIACTNPLFVHRGTTVLFLLNGNPITLEATVYGVFSAMMLLSVFYWCRCYSEIITSDKFIYLFGKAIPKLSLTLSMALAFIPKLVRKYREIDEAQRALGIYATDSYPDRVRSKMRVLSILLTHSLESSIDTADSMRARGYGFKGRTSYAVYRFSRFDALHLLFSLTLGIGSAALILLGTDTFSYYPTFSLAPLSLRSYLLYLSLILLTGASLFLEVKENILWRYLRSKT